MGNLVGNSVGNLAGNSAGNLVGNSVGNLAGNSAGNLAGNSVGNLVGKWQNTLTSAIFGTSFAIFKPLTGIKTLSNYFFSCRGGSKL